MGASQIGVERIEDFVLTVSKNHYYRCYSNGGQPIFVYEGHKFIVPILWLAQSKNYISYPINLVYFDRHHDALVEGKRKEIASDIKKAKTFDEVFEIVADRLNTNNNTWLRLLMDLEIVKDAVMIGDSKYAHNDWNELEKFTDLKGNKHSLENIPQLEGAFNSQGNLDDIANRVLLEPLWDILGWKNIPQGGFEMSRSSILLDCDLDYFTFKWRERHYSWLDNFYSKEFDMQSTCHAPGDWSGDKFLNELIKRAPFITIAKESIHCGGRRESNRVLKKLNDKFFSGVIQC